MNTLLKGISTFSTRMVYAIYGIFSTILIVNYFSDWKKENYIVVLVSFLVLSLLGTFMLRKGSSYLEKWNEKVIFGGLLLICLIVKFTWIYLHRIEPLVDYATFYYTAESLSQNFVIQNRYIALFPHIFGYASFLSIFFKLFGANTIIPPIVNVVLSTISMALIYFICRRILGVKTAITASILWIILPSQTIYNMFAMSEPLYCTILLLIWAVMIVTHETFSNITIPKLLFYSILLAVLLVLMNMARPIAAIPLIALAIWLFIINTGHIGNKNVFMKKIVHMTVILVSYFALSAAANYYITVRLGEKIASTPGYNIYVGFNMDSLGAWNKEDAELLGYYDNQKGWSADDAQKQMLEEAKKRIKSGEVDFQKLFTSKFFMFLSDDSTAFKYAEPVLNHKIRYVVTSNIFYYFLMVMSLLGIFVAFKNNNKSFIFVICLYPIGLTMSHMLVEVSARYHYSIMLPMTILAAYGINYMFSKKSIGIN